MLHEDYIMRHIAQLVEALQRILSLTRSQGPPETIEAIDEVFEDVFGLDSGAMTKLSLKGLLMRLTWGDTTAAGRAKCIVVAALLKEAGQIHARQGRPDESYACHLSALDLLLSAHLQQPEATLPDYAPPVETLSAELAGYILPVETNKLLLAYYEQTGDYAKAEDTLFEVIRNEPGNTELVELGIAFYQRLWEQSDEQLSAGDLPREEVEAGLAELESYRER